MSFARRPEPAPACSSFNHTTFADCLAALNNHSGVGADAVSNIKIPYARQGEAGWSRTGATLRDVMHTLWTRRPVMDEDVFALRTQTVPGDPEEKKRLIETLHARMARIRASSRTSVNVPVLLPVRNFRANDGGGIRVDDLLDAAALACGHATLASLALQGNDIVPRVPEALRTFALAVSLSNLRAVNLSNNAIGSRSLVEFLDNLHTPSLTHLYLSMTMLYKDLQKDQSRNPLWKMGDQSWRTEATDEVWKKEAKKVTDRLVRLLTPLQSRTAPYAPNLKWLAFSGNDLGFAGVKRIVRAVRYGNYSIEKVELYAADPYYEEPDMFDFPRPAVESDVEDESPNVQQPLVPLTAGPEDNDEGDERHDRHGNPELDGSGEPNSEYQSSSVHITRHNYAELLQVHGQESAIDSRWTIDASRKLLPILRILTCKSRLAPRNGRDAAGFPFVLLPLELRTKVVAHLDEQNALTNQQLERIISFASEPATIGYGERSKALGLTSIAQKALRSEVNEAQLSSADATDKPDDYGLLLHKRFRWRDMIARHSVPRDWPASVLDESGDIRQGGEGQHSDPVSRNRRVWLSEQSGLQAFLEATGTHALEKKMPMADLLVVHGGIPQRS